MKNIIKNIAKNKKGSSLVEVVIAVGMFSIVASALVTVLYSSNKVTQDNMDMRQTYESTVGRMDVQLEESAGTTPSDGSNVDVSDVTVSVKFPIGSTTNVECEKTVDGNYSGVGIVKAK